MLENEVYETANQPWGWEMKYLLIFEDGNMNVLKGKLSDDLLHGHEDGVLTIVDISDPENLRIKIENSWESIEEITL